MNLIQKLNIHKKAKYIIFLLILIFILYLLIAIYSFLFQQEELNIDKYNFKQLQKVKKIIKNTPGDIKYFLSLKDFNEVYKTNITPIKNCYSLSRKNGNKPYIFGFMLESLIYKFIYFGPYYAYPSYDRDKDNFCFGEGSIGGACYVTSKQPFIDRISNPCKD